MARLSFPQTCTSLPNEVQGVLAHAPHLTCAHVSIAIAAGYLDEPHALPGLAHLLEHVLTIAPLAASPNTSLLAWFTQHQGSLNARTDDYVTDVHFSIPVSKLAAAAITVAAQVANPRMPLPTIHAEVAAIDAEWQARQHSRQMQRLNALAAMANPQHIGAGCRHGNAQTLGQDAEALLNRLARFHRDHYHGGRVSIAMISPWPMEEMACLAERMAALFTPPPPHAPTLTITSRWGRLPNAQVRGPSVSGSSNSVEFFWPLPSAASYHQLTALIDLADSLNQGHLAEQLPASITHYHATTAPAGATDSFSLQLSGALQPDAVLAPLTDQLNQCISGLRFDILRERGNAWQPPTDTVQLAPAWFAHARHQAIARRYATLPANQQPLVGSLFTTGNARWLIGNAPTPSAAATFDLQPPPSPSPRVQCWCGQYDVQADFNTLTDDTWAACFVPGAVIVPSPRTAQRIAHQGMVFKQENSPHGSWVMVVGSGANHAMLALLEAAALALPAAQEGLLAQQLIQRLTSLPATPVVWVSHQAESDAITQAVADLVSRLPTYAGNISEGTPSATGSQPASTAVMRTLRLPGTPAQRWLLAVAERHHSALFFQQARDKHRLGYVAAVRRGDGAPCSLGYVVQTNEDVGSIEETLKAITGALWQGTNSTQWKQPATPTAPETPLAALIIQWQSLLSGAVQPLHRLARENLTPEAATELLTQLNTCGRWQTHRLDSTGHYLVSD